MNNLQDLVDAFSASAQRERSKYHATFGDLLDKLQNADESLRLSPEITGIGSYRGYYSDIALLTAYNGIDVYKNEDDYDSIKHIEMPQNPKMLLKVLESLIGKYFDGYKGGYNKITLDKPLWIASDYGNCSNVAVIDITDDLKLVTKFIE